MLRKIRFVTLSIVLHGVLLFCLSTFTRPIENKHTVNKPIESYLYIDKSKPALLPAQSPSVSSGEIIRQKSPKINLSDQVNIQNEVPIKIDRPTKNSLNTQTAPQENMEKTFSTSNTRIDVSRYVETLNKKELEKLSGSALKEFKKPKPLLSRTSPLSANQKLKELSTSFAPLGSGIVVLSEFGPDETTILLGDSCFTITHTALDDKIWKGASRWSRSNGCGKYDKFDGQLQKSLDKYLQK